MLKYRQIQYFQLTFNDHIHIKDNEFRQERRICLLKFEPLTNVPFCDSESINLVKDRE